MSVTVIPQPIRYMLWGMAAGRCEYRGCNKPLYLDPHTRAQFNQAYIAHIIADSADGPRGDITLSPLLAKDLSNLMLLCDTHHRLVDREDVAGHTIEILQQMKRDHESRIALTTDVQEDMYTQLVLYGANVGHHSYPVTRERTITAISPNRYPAQYEAIEIGLKNSELYDHEEEFWHTESSNLKRHVENRLRPQLASGKCRHISVFALAPQPLLITLGILISDICAADVFQLHREPEQTWKWQNYPEDFEFIILEPKTQSETVALNFSLSATIHPSRITDVLGSDTSIWTVTVAEPHNDFMKSAEQLALFRFEIRKLLNRIKQIHGEDSCVHVFPAMPISTAVEFGRIWMPKADLPLTLYDHSRKRGGFVRALDIKA